MTQPPGAVSAELKVYGVRAAVFENHEMLKAVIDLDKCICYNVCLAREACSPRAIIQLDPGGPAIVDSSQCNGCGDCVSECPELAINMKEF